MKTLKEIELRLAAIAQEVETDGADLDALETEARSLKEARQALLDAAEKRNKILADVAGMTGTPAVVAPKAEARSFDNMNNEDVIATPEYRNAYIKDLIGGREMTDMEKRAWAVAAERRAWTTTAASAGPAIPTALADQIMKKAHQTAPLLTEITMLHVPGYVTYAVEGTTADASEHTENADLTAASDTLSDVHLSGYEVNKYQEISKSVRQMAIPAFETFITNTMGDAMARRLVSRIIKGSGSGQATGIDKANTWTDGTNSVTVAKAGTLTSANVLDLIGLLPGGYDRNAKFLMSKKTLFSDFLPLQDKGKNDLVVWQGGVYYIQGYPVLLDDTVTLHEAYLGDLTKYIGNMAEEINVTTDHVLKGNKYAYLGSCMFDGKPALGEAFVKLVKATA